MLALEAPRVLARVSTTAAMLVDARFEVGGRWVHPFALAPWVADREPVDATLPGHVRMLGAEFVAAPFGSSGRPPALHPRWQDAAWSAAPDPPHGQAAHRDWKVVERTVASVTLELHLDDDGPIHRLRRTITLAEREAALDLELEVESRRNTRVPLALHPIFRLPETDRHLRLRVPAHRGFTYPGRVDPSAVTAPWRVFDDLTRVPARDSGTIDLSRLPIGRRVEDVALLTELSGPVTLLYEDDSSLVELSWDRTALPSVHLWISDRALQTAPWSGRYRGLGVEPCAAAFDLPPSVSTGANPLTALGVPTALALRAHEPRRIRSRITVRDAVRH